MGDEVDHKNSKGDLLLDFAFNCKIQKLSGLQNRNPDFPIEHNPRGFVPEEARLLIADEDDQFFFQIRWVLQMCQDFNSQDFELIICGIVSAVCIAMYSSS